MYNKRLLYDTFNAKYLSYQEVASTFIPNDEYHQLITNSHSLLMGPRGCGKTTLLKMLTIAALDFWPNELAKQIKSRIPFIAVYVPSDIQWKSQLIYMEKHLPKNTEFNERITEFLIITNVQIHLCRTFGALIRLSGMSEQEKLVIEEVVSKELISTWAIGDADHASFDNIETLLLNRVDKVSNLVNRIIDQKKCENLFQEFPEYIYSSFLITISRGCQVFEKNTNLQEKNRWAICFDELEIVPSFFQKKLYSLLRSSDPKFLFKLTTTPIVHLDGEITEASQDNDFKPVRLWVYDDSGESKWEKFCETLIGVRIKRKLGKSLAPEEILTSYDYSNLVIDELEIKYKPQEKKKINPDYELFKALASRDESFRQFLKVKKIDPDNPHAKDELEVKSVFLKHRTKVLYRYIFGKRRKTPAINYGVPYIYDICDGNPRAIIGLIDDLLNGLSSSVVDGVEISTSKQSEIVLKASQRYFNLIKNHPDSTLIFNGKQYNLATEILKKVGNYIYGRIVKGNFEPTVPTTFTVPSNIDPKMLKLLEHALFLGAIIYLDPIESLSKTGLINKRFRLSYLLTPLFRIPNRVDGYINLSTILNDNTSQLGLEFENFEP